MQEMQKPGGSPRGPVFWTALGLLAGLLAWRLAGPALTACRPHPRLTGTVVSPASPSGLPYADLPGVELAGLTERQRFTVLHRASIEHCDCGCKETVAECRHGYPSCKVGLRLARKIAEEVRSS